MSIGFIEFLRDLPEILATHWKPVCCPARGRVEASGERQPRFQRWDRKLVGFRAWRPAPRVRRAWLGSNVAWGAGADILKGMFETIEAQLATAADKLKHLRRFL